MKLTVTKLVEEYLLTNPDLILPLLNRKTPILERLLDICRHMQSETIFKICGDPLEFDDSEKEKSINKISNCQEKYNKLLYERVGREHLIKKLPDFIDLDLIIKKLKLIYSKKPKRAGDYAEKYFSYNPFFDRQITGSNETREYYKKIHFKQSDLDLTFQEDYFCIDCLYEFKLTKSSRLNQMLKQAYIQIQLYDFFLRIMYPRFNYYKGLYIEILLIDKNEILSFGEIFGKRNNSFSVDKNLLKDLINKTSLPSKEYFLKKCDEIYDNSFISFCDEDDSEWEKKVFYRS